MKKVSKKILYTGSTLIVLVIAVLAFYFLESKGKVPFFNKAIHEAASGSVNTAKIEGGKTALPINEHSSEEAVIQAMHEMSHQKVKAKEKWGAIPLTQNTANAVYDIVNNSDFKHKDQLLEIAGRWKNGDFSSIVQDHNYFWELQGGTVGKAYGELSKTEEESFVLNNFGAEVAKQLKN